MMDWRTIPPLSALRAFEATARLGGFSAAARSLNVTHAAVAQQVRALEAELGVALVYRDGRALALTPAGARLAEGVSEGFGLVQRAVDGVRVGRGDGPVRVTLTASFAAQWLMPRLRDFWARHPDVPLSLHPDTRVVDLRREGMDLGIRYGQGDWPEVSARRLAAGRMVVVGTPAMAGRGALSVAELARLPWVLSSEWPEANAWLTSQGLPPSELKVTWFPDASLAVAAARQGLGLAIEDIALAEEDIRNHRLSVVLDRDEMLPAYFVVTPRGPQRDAARTFLSWLARQA
jgi:LysR family glycine cleavage system transcriptional activator